MQAVFSVQPEAVFAFHCTASAAALQAILRLTRLLGSTFDASPVLAQLLPHPVFRVRTSVDMPDSCMV